ncbi:MBL fold metallo-hydrolase, partial [Escherichia coli]
MKIIQVRNATQLISYAGKKFLVDPMLAKKEAYPGFEGTARSDIRIPMTELPFDLDVLLDVDAIIVTHTHPDHWDEAAVAHIPKDKLIYVQNEH